MSAKQKSKLAVMIVFWSVMFLADVFIIAYGLLNLFLLREYALGVLSLLFGLIDIYGNWWHISIGLDQLAGRVPAERASRSQHVNAAAPADDSQSTDFDATADDLAADTPDADAADDARDTSASDQPRHLKSDSSPRRAVRSSLKKMFGLNSESKEQQLMRLRRTAADADDLADGHPQYQEVAADADGKLVVDSVSNPLDQDAFAGLPQAKKRELMGKHHQAESASRARSQSASSADSASSDAAAAASSDSLAELPAAGMKKGYDLNQIPTLRLAAMPSDRRKPGDAMPDDWIDDAETDQIIAQARAREEAKKKHEQESQSAESEPAESDAGDHDIIAPDFDPTDDHQIDKMIARYDRERAEKEKAKQTAD